MENGANNIWRFKPNDAVIAAEAVTVRKVHYSLIAKLNPEDDRRLIQIAHGDPSPFPSFRTAAEAEHAVVQALTSANHNSYAPPAGLLDARRAVAEYLSPELPYKLSPDHVFLTLGCAQAIEVAVNVLSRPGANILLPRPGFPHYDAVAAYCHLGVRHVDLLQEKGWEVDVEAVEAAADENTVALVIINPGNPCGNVYSYQHLKEIAETARKLGILVIADEVYAHLTFGRTPFVPMGALGSIAPVLTLGSISKRWTVPGWRIGWLVTCDPNGILQDAGIVESIKVYQDISPHPATFIQAAIPRIIQNTKADFFSRINGVLRETVDICYSRLQDIPCITCTNKPEGCMFVMVKLNLSSLEGIRDDTEFCLKLSEEESVLVLPGIAVGLKNWLRITFAIEPSLLEAGLQRLKDFCERYAKKTP